MLVVSAVVVMMVCRIGNREFLLHGCVGTVIRVCRAVFMGMVILIGFFSAGGQNE